MAKVKRMPEITIRQTVKIGKNPGEFSGKIALGKIKLSYNVEIKQKFPIVLEVREIKKLRKIFPLILRNQNGKRIRLTDYEFDFIFNLISSSCLNNIKTRYKRTILINGNLKKSLAKAKFK